MDKLYLDENNRLHKCDGSHEATHVHMTIEEYEEMYSTIQNLKRINKERSNKERGLEPKKQRSGYILLSYDTNNFRINFEKEQASFECRRLLLETPHTINLGYKDAYKLILEEVCEMAGMFGATTAIERAAIVNRELFNSFFEADADKILFITGLEAQRNGVWAVRIYANFTPDVPVDCIKSLGGK